MPRPSIFLVVFTILPNIAMAQTASEILSRAFDNEAGQRAVRAQYFYREHADRFRAGSDGKRGKLSYTRDYEWVYLEGEPFRKLVAIDGHPLKGKQAEEEEQRIRMTGAERRAAAAQKKPNPRVIDIGNVELPVILRTMQHKLLKEETIGDRNTWVIVSEPKAELVPSSKQEEHARCYRFTFWVDQRESAIVQQEYQVIAKGVDALPGSRTRAVFKRVSDGLWFAATLEGYYETARPQPPDKWFQSHRFYDFKKFGAESTIVFVDPHP